MPAIETDPQSKRRAPWLWFVDLALLAALILIPLSWLLDPLETRLGPMRIRVSWEIWRFAILVILLIARTVAGRTWSGGFAGAMLFKRLTFAWMMTFLSFLALETLASHAGIEETQAPIRVVGNEADDTPIDDNVKRDPELLWAFVPNDNWDGYPINRHGFRTRDFEAEKPRGMRRVIALGDSCTAQGKPPYSDLLDELLQFSPPTPDTWEAFNMGVFGYSSMQGQRQFELHGMRFAPDVVTIYYGWNDHWLFEKPDHLRMAVRLPPWQAKLGEALKRKRFYAFLTKLGRRSTTGKQEATTDGKVYRVPHDIYRETLAHIIRNVREIGATPILITAARRALSDSGIRSGHIRSVEEAQRVHDEYVEITREVAAETGTPLLDLAATYAAPEFDGFFMRDGIHFNQDGLKDIAARIHAKLTELAGTNGLAFQQGKAAESEP